MPPLLLPCTTVLIHQWSGSLFAKSGRFLVRRRTYQTISGGAESQTKPPPPVRVTCGLSMCAVGVEPVSAQRAAQAGPLERGSLSRAGGRPHGRDAHGGRAAPMRGPGRLAPCARPVALRKRVDELARTQQRHKAAEQQNQNKKLLSDSGIDAFRCDRGSGLCNSSMGLIQTARYHYILHMSATSFDDFIRGCIRRKGPRSGWRQAVGGGCQSG